MEYLGSHKVNDDKKECLPWGNISHRQPNVYFVDGTNSAAVSHNYCRFPVSGIDLW